MRTVRGVLTAIAFVTFTLLLMPVQLLVLSTGFGNKSAVPTFYHRWALKLLGFRVKFDGTPATGAALIAANHSSWLDIPVLGSLIPLSFIAKREVRSWPLFGQLAQLQRTVFIDRERRSATSAAKSEIRGRLESGDRLVLFAEGTSNDGNSVLPFRTALFGAVSLNLPVEAESGDHPVAVQPVSIAYVRLHGLPMGRLFRPGVAWYGDMSLGPHLWGVFCSGPVDVAVRFHVPVSLDQFTDRKELARHCEAVVRAGVTSALVGRELAPGEVNPPGAEPEAVAAIAPVV